MTKPMKNTAAALLVFLALQFVLWTALLAWEGFAAVSPNHAALITTVVRAGWEAQPWAFLLTITTVTGILAFLGGHFFAFKKGQDEQGQHQD